MKRVVNFALGVLKNVAILLTILLLTTPVYATLIEVFNPSQGFNIESIAMTTYAFSFLSLIAGWPAYIVTGIYIELLRRSAQIKN